MGSATCKPSSCPPPLNFFRNESFCASCINNTFGQYPNCTKCSIDSSSLCPGFTTLPLSVIATSTSASSCRPLADVVRLLPARRRNGAIGVSWLTKILTVDSALLCGSSLFLLLLSVYAAARLFAVSSVEAAFEFCDAFSVLTIPYPLKAKRGVPLDVQSRSIGGILSLLAGLTFVTIALVLVLQRDADNVSRQESIVTLTDARREAALKLPVVSASDGSFNFSSGIQVRVTASGDGDVCSSGVRWLTTETSAWNLTQTPLCGDGDGGSSDISGVSQLVFTCPDCSLLSPTSSLSITLPFSCQSLLIEAAAVDAAGLVSFFTMPANKTRAAPGELLTTLSWKLPTLLSVVNSSVDPSASARGFTLTTLSNSIVSQTLQSVDNGNGLAINPTSTVSITIDFPLNTFYSLTVLTEKQSITALLASIVGLLGIVSFFRSLLNSADWIQQLREGRSKDAPTSNRGDGEFDMPNPLHDSRQRSEHAFVPPPPTGARQRFTVANLADHITSRANQPRYTQYVEGADTWFHCRETGETFWELPAGAVCNMIVDVESSATPHSPFTRRVTSERLLRDDDAPYDLPRSARGGRGAPTIAPAEESPSSISRLAESIAREHFNAVGEDAHMNLRATARAIMVTDMTGRDPPPPQSE